MQRIAVKYTITMNFKVNIAPDSENDELVSFTVADNETILSAALREEIGLSYSCLDGLCGACKARLHSGSVTYPDGRPEALSEAEQNEGLTLLCQAHATSDLTIEANVAKAIAGIPIRRMPCRVSHHEQLAHDVMRLDLKLPGSMSFEFLAGQYIDFILKDGRRRSFSIANAPHSGGHIELHVRYVDGGEFTEYVFASMQDKAMLRIEGPLGTFYLREDSQRPIIFIAGGTGFAPIKGLVEHALHSGITRPMHIYWGARALRDLYMDALPRQWAKQHAHIHFTPVLSDPMPEDNWQGRTGFVHEAVMQDFEDLSGFDIYAGGPPQMVSAGYDAFTTKGLTGEHYFSDAFEYARDNKNKR